MTNIVEPRCRTVPDTHTDRALTLIEVMPLTTAEVETTPVVDSNPGVWMVWFPIVSDVVPIHAVGQHVPFAAPFASIVRVVVR